MISFDEGPTLFCIPLSESEIRRYNASAFYRTGKKLECLSGLDGLSGCERIFENTQSIITTLELISNARRLDFSDGTRKAAVALVALVRSLEALGEESGELIAEPCELIRKKFQTFEDLFLSDAESLDLFYVPDVLAYDSKKLIESGEKLISEDLRPLMSNLLKGDMRDAARCLAFELGTAAAFHFVLRLFCCRLANKAKG